MALWGWLAPRSYSTSWAILLALVVATGIVLAFVGLWRLVPLRFLATQPEPITWNETDKLADDPSVWPPAPKLPHS